MRRVETRSPADELPERVKVGRDRWPPHSPRDRGEWGAVCPLRETGCPKSGLPTAVAASVATRQREPFPRFCHRQSKVAVKLFRLL